MWGKAQATESGLQVGMPGPHLHRGTETPTAYHPLANTHTPHSAFLVIVGAGRIRAWSKRFWGLSGVERETSQVTNLLVAEVVQTHGAGLGTGFGGALCCPAQTAAPGLEGCQSPQHPVLEQIYLVAEGRHS